MLKNGVLSFFATDASPGFASSSEPHKVVACERGTKGQLLLTGSSVAVDMEIIMGVEIVMEPYYCVMYWGRVAADLGKLKRRIVSVKREERRGEG